MDPDHQNAAPVIFTAAGDTPEERDNIVEMVQNSPGFNPAANIVAEAIHKDADLTVLDYTAQQVNLRFRIDGLWHPGPPMDRQTGDYMLAVLKQLAGTDYRDRRNKQTGNFATEYLRQKQKFKIVSQGNPAGERVGLYLSYKRPPLDSLDDLGIRKSMIPQIVALMKMDHKGTFLVSAVPGEGYTSSWRAALDSCDRLIKDFFVIEDVTAQEPEVINITPETFDSRKGETAMTPMPQLLLREPHVLALPSLINGTLVDQFVEISSKHDIPVYMRNPGKNAIDALLRVLALNPKRKEFMELLSGVLCMRLVRKLCEDCRIGYQPHPKLLQKLGLPAGRIEKLYRPFVFQPGMVDEEQNEIQPCTNCNGIGYKGRTGIFELLTINAEIRESATRSPQFKSLMAIARKHGHITLQQEAAVVIAQGITSVEELQRMLQA
jgi:type II secretory ATPase GspE/PulE/Tfp pilus assembly ATPase PilB-like protein